MTFFAAGVSSRASSPSHILPLVWRTFLVTTAMSSSSSASGARCIGLGFFAFVRPSFAFSSADARDLARALLDPREPLGDAVSARERIRERVSASQPGSRVARYPTGGEIVNRERVGAAAAVVIVREGAAGREPGARAQGAAVGAAVGAVPPWVP